MNTRLPHPPSARRQTTPRPPSPPTVTATLITRGNRPRPSPATADRFVFRTSSRLPPLLRVRRRQLLDRRCEHQKSPSVDDQIDTLSVSSIGSSPACRRTRSENDLKNPQTTCAPAERVPVGWQTPTGAHGSRVGSIFRNLNSYMSVTHCRGRTCRRRPSRRRAAPRRCPQAA